MKLIRLKCKDGKNESLENFKDFFGSLELPHLRLTRYLRLLGKPTYSYYSERWGGVKGSHNVGSKEVNAIVELSKGKFFITACLEQLIEPGRFRDIIREKKEFDDFEKSKNYLVQFFNKNFNK